MTIDPAPIITALRNVRGSGVFLTAAQVDAMIRRYRWWTLAGASLTCLGFMTDGFGVVTGMIGMWLSGGSETLGAWRYEKGLWRFSALFLTIALLCFTGFTYGHLGDIIQPGGGVPGMIDQFGIALLWMQSRFLLTVTALNWKLTHS